jgi:hypothetical protein
MAQVMKAVALILLKSGSARINMAQGMWAKAQLYCRMAQQK